MTVRCTAGLDALERRENEEGEEPPEDPRNELVQRLLEYQKIKEVAETLAEVSSVRLGLWLRCSPRAALALLRSTASLEVSD